MARLLKRVWENDKVQVYTKIIVYRACVVIPLLYGSQAWTTYAE